jgi:hypothetical protein
MLSFPLSIERRSQPHRVRPPKSSSTPLVSQRFLAVSFGRTAEDSESSPNNDANIYLAGNLQPWVEAPPNKPANTPCRQNQHPVPARSAERKEMTRKDPYKCFARIKDGSVSRIGKYCN